MKRTARRRPAHPLVEHWDDERDIGNGIIVTLRPGHFFYDDCGVMGFDTLAEALDALLEVYRREQTAAVRT
ncbi:MAG: hypothetical protein KDD75_16135 [Caldilineaceae bacterium]|nr:hypothetical protein [Caldilineaceae bacterium]